MLLALLQVSDVGNNDVDAEQLGFGEHQPRVDDDYVVSRMRRAIMFMPNSPSPPSGIAQTEGLLNSMSNLSRGKYRTTQRDDSPPRAQEGIEIRLKGMANANRDRRR